jgi:hypothetical protein
VGLGVSRQLEYTVPEVAEEGSSETPLNIPRPK